MARYRNRAGMIIETAGGVVLPAEYELLDADLPEQAQEPAHEPVPAEEEAAPEDGAKEKAADAEAIGSAEW